MATFEFDGHDDDAFVAGVVRGQTSRHPYTNEPQPLRTTQSQEPPREGLTAYTVSELLQGAGLNKPSAISYDAFNQTMSGDLGNFIRSEDGIRLGGRNQLLAHDILNKRGFGDGIFTMESGIGKVTGGSTRGPGGQTPQPGGAPVPPGERSGAIEQVLEWGESQVGTPYNQCIGRPQDPPCSEENKPPTPESPSTSGRFGPNWYDCSGFVTSAFFFGMGLLINPSNGNYNTTYSMLAQPELMALEVGANDAQPGDIVLAQPHVAIYWGNGKIIDSGSPGVSIRDNWMPSYYSDTRFFRVINLPW